MRRGATIGLLLLATGCAGAAAAPAGFDATTTASPPSTTTTASAPSTSASTTSTIAADDVPAALRDLRLADDRGQVVEIVDGEAAPPWPNLLAMDGRTVVGTKGNQVYWVPPGSSGFSVPVEGEVGGRISDRELVPLVTDPSGEWVALGPSQDEPAPGTIAAARTTTELVLVRSGDEMVTVELDGNFVPEAFSLERQDGAAPWLYVLEYLPAEAPTRYRVRLLDSNTGELSWPLNLRDKTASVDTEMAGISRDQIVASGRALLFTLYRGHHGETDDAYAFIHVLSMWGGVWCLEVPAELDLGNLTGVVAVSPDESTLYAVSANGYIAEYSIDDVSDPQRTPVARRVVHPMNWVDEPPVAVATDEHLIVGHGRTVTWYDRADLTIVGQASDSSSTPEALAVSDAGDVVVATGGTLGIAEPSEPIEPLIVLPPGTGQVTRIALS